MPILFSKPMVLAVLAGRKTQTRRLAAPGAVLADARFRPGDSVWVKERWATAFALDAEPPRAIAPGSAAVFYAADCSIIAADGQPAPPVNHFGRDRSSLFMPQWASRLSIQVTGVRLEPLQAISEADCAAEGIERDGQWWRNYAGGPAKTGPVASYRSLWDFLNPDVGARWSDNPQVFVYEFQARVTRSPGEPA